MTRTDMARLTPPVGERDHAQGSAAAPVTLVEYGDYECPYCRAAMPIVREVQRLLGESVRFVYRHFPVSNLHPHARRAAEAAEAAGAQGKFWEMHEHLFRHQEALDGDHLVRYASEIGLDVERFQRDLADHAFARRVAEDLSSAIESGADGTPTFYLDGVRYEGPVGVTQLLGAIRRAHPDLAGERVEPAETGRIPRVVGQRSRYRSGRDAA